MDYPQIFKSKRQKWLEITVGLAVIVIIIMVLVFSGSSDDTIATPSADDDTKDNTLNYVIAAIVGCGLGYFLLRKRDNNNIPILPDGEIIEFIADTIYRDHGIYLDTRIYNVRVQRGIPGEAYVEFLKEALMFLHYSNIGIIERYPGESIKVVTQAKELNKIQSSLAENGIADSRHFTNLKGLELTDEKI